MPVRVTPAAFQEKHARRLKAALEDMRAGVNQVTESPGIAAAEAQTKMRTNLVAAIDNGTWARRVSAVPLQAWKDAMVNKGIPRVSAGIDGAAGKVREFATQLIEHENRVLEEVDRLPDVTLEDSINRATTWIRRMSEFTRR